MYFPIVEKGVEETNGEIHSGFYTQIDKKSLSAIEENVQNFYFKIKNQMKDLNNIFDPAIFDVAQPKLLMLYRKPMFNLGRGESENEDSTDIWSLGTIQKNSAEEMSGKPKKGHSGLKLNSEEKIKDLQEKIEKLNALLQSSLEELRESRLILSKEKMYKRKYKETKEKLKEARKLLEMHEHNSESENEEKEEEVISRSPSVMPEEKDVQDWKSNTPEKQFSEDGMTQKFQESYVHQLKREKWVMLSRIKQLEEELKISNSQKSQLEQRLFNLTELMDEKSMECLKLQKRVIKLKKRVKKMDANGACSGIVDKD